MILFKNYGKEKNEIISALLSEIPSEYVNDNVMIAQDGDEIIGSCFYEIEGQFCKLNYVHMMTDEELIKDGQLGFLTVSSISGMLEGAEPILYQGQLVGALGVSGVKSHQDAQIAQHAIDVFLALAD